MPEISVAELTDYARGILVGLGTPERIAAIVADSLVLANRSGHDSHGVVRLREYSTFVDQGRVIPDAEPTVVSDFGAVTVIDGQHGWGQYVSLVAVEHAREAARRFGVGVVTVRNANHVGRIGEYAEVLAGAGLASMIWCNADPCVAPFGGTERLLGTNPFAAGVPVAGGDDVVLDFATAAVAEGKLRVARAAGESIPSGAVIDAKGRPTTDPNDFYDGGALLPFGGHKGYGLSVVVELLGGALSGNHPSIASRYVSGNGLVITAYDPAAFGERADFDSDVSETAARLRAATPVDEERPVLLPGDAEGAARRARGALVPIGDTIWADVRALHDERATARQS